MSPDKNKKRKFSVIGRDFKYRLQDAMVISDKLEWIDLMNLLSEEWFAQVEKLAREYHFLSKGNKGDGQDLFIKVLRALDRAGVAVPGILAAKDA